MTKFTRTTQLTIEQHN